MPAMHMPILFPLQNCFVQNRACVSFLASPWLFVDFQSSRPKKLNSIVNQSGNEINFYESSETGRVRHKNGSSRGRGNGGSRSHNRRSEFLAGVEILDYGVIHEFFSIIVIV